MDIGNRLCLLFVGLTELRRQLQMSVHESLDQRIVIRCNSPRLSREELPEYLSHRLSVAGCELRLFEPASTEAFYQATRSLPRKVNRFAHYVLTAAAIAKGKSVSEKHVKAAMSETEP